MTSPKIVSGNRVIYRNVPYRLREPFTEFIRENFIKAPKWIYLLIVYHIMSHGDRFLDSFFLT